MHVPSKRRSMFVLAAFALAGGSWVVASAADRPTDWKPSATIHIGYLPSASTLRPTQLMPEGRFDLRNFDHRLEEIHGKTHRIGTLLAYYSIGVTRADGDDLAAGLWFNYVFEEGKSAPMLDQMYKFVTVNSAHFELDIVTDNDLVKNLPKDRRLIVVPAGSSLEFRIGGGHPVTQRSFLDVSTITGDDTAASPRQVHVTINNAAQAAQIRAPADTKTYDAAVGDVLPLVMGCELTVRRIVPADEKHNILGWVEFSPVPAGHEAELRKRVVEDTFTYAIVGTDPAFETVMASNHVRKGLLAPREMRDLIGSRHDLERISGALRLEARIDRGDLLFLWTFDGDFSGSPADAIPKLRDSLKVDGRLQESKSYGKKHRNDLREQQDPAVDESTVFSAANGDHSEHVTASLPEKRPDRKGYRQHFIWAVAGRWDNEIPTLRQLVEACPLLKPPPSGKATQDFLGDRQIWSCSVPFADDPAAGWSVEAAGEIRPELESLLSKLGFKESPQTVHALSPRDPDGTEQRTWKRTSDSNSVSLTPLGEKIEVGYEGPQRPK